ncbi:putative polyketide synthase [Annulohypoxylon bovei var. microspora]|nr:putative polyketide synthase [Annulohypoxylon bovei var. microspora]
MSKSEPVPIAIIGMGCRYPAGANSPEALWSVVAEGRDGWTEVPPDRFNGDSFYHPDPDAPGSINQKGGHFINQSIAAFDAAFFGISSVEAEALDPQQRVVLETSWEAVENAGIPMQRFRGSDTGIFVAMFGHDYEQIAHKDPLSFTRYHNTGIARPLLANRVSYVFDLQGPSIMLDTACSGSLVAVNSACQSLRAGETKMALAGGVGLIFSPDQMALMSLTGLFNGEGRSYTFDARGNGYGRAEGVGMIALKRLDDAVRDGDNIRAIIRSSGVNSDGRTNGITLPNQLAQERLARSLFRHLDFTPAEVQYAEAHGTGTKAGDLAEMLSIRDVFCEGRDSQLPLFVGASKQNIGHSEAASGTAGLIKTVVAMEKGLIPPNLHLETFKPGIEPEKWNIKIAQSLTPWPSAQVTRRAVVNSFGFGGTNAMVVLESGRNQSASNYTAGVNGVTNGMGDHHIVHMKKENIANHGKSSQHLFTLSARSEHSLLRTIVGLKDYLMHNNHVNLDDLSHTLATRRSPFQWRSSVVAQNVESLVKSLGADSLGRNRVLGHISTIFVFTGQGAQWAQMGYHLLLGDNEFSRSISLSEAILQSLGAQWSLIDELSRDGSSSLLNDSKYGQPASTAIQLALVDLLKSWNVHPAAVIGHSSGEIAAAYAAGAITHSAAIRISYHRSFLAEASRNRASQPGSMMAVGLGQEDVEKYMSKLAVSGVEIACMNSPSSTTVSGDAEAIWDLKVALDADGVFARQLRVDTAYHSHHMRLVSDDYLSRLEGVESGSASPTTRFFSTVTGEEKRDGFGPSYWVENLVSPVRFSSALQRLCQEIGQTSFGMIEVGPHKALAGPIRQTLAESQAEGLLYNYIPTLVRGENSCDSLIATGSGLFMFGGEFDVGAAASLGISSRSPIVLQDLPPYHWDHTTIHWEESRLSREYRSRRHPHHDLLGSRIITSPDSQPSWRNILRTDRLPWLKDHVVDNFIIFPAAGYMTMAIQAMMQLDQDCRPDLVAKGYRLKNVYFKKSLTLPKDSRGIETILTFRSSDVNEKYEFSVFSVSDQGKWQKHCTGCISTTFAAGLDEFEQRPETGLNLESPEDYLRNARDSCTRVIKQDDLYAQMAATGNLYGPNFAVNKEARVADFQSLNSIFIPDIAATMPSQFMQPHLIHPATLDGVIQTCVPLFQQHSVQGSVMPLFIGDTFVSADITNNPGNRLEVICDLSDTLPHSTNFNTTVLQVDENTEPKCVIAIEKGEIRVVGESQSLSETRGNDNIFKMQWGIDTSYITAELLESIIIPLQSNEVGMSQAEKVNNTFIICARYIDWTVKEIRDGGLAVADDHRANLWKWLVRFSESDAGQDLIRKSPETKDELDWLTSKLGVEGESIARIGPQITAILTGQTDPLTLFLRDELLFRVYHGDECARPNRYMAEYAKIRTFQARNLRILELGAGTGGTTFQILQACSPGGEEFCSEYMYTDISSGFFESVRTTRLKTWEHLLTFRTFDLEKDPSEQGFEENSYDLVIAANVVHATRSLSRSLNMIHRLLKPGGVLGLVELTKTTPFINMTFGSIAGWWAGVDEGRTESPLQSVEQWNEHLVKASFSGIDLAAHDLPEPERHSALLLSTALSADKGMNGHHISPIKILNAVQGGPGQSFSDHLCQSLALRNFKPSIIEWSNSEVDESCAYVIVDSVDNLLLTNASPIQFTTLTSLLSKACVVYWITLADGAGGIVPDNAMAAGLARTARNENPKLKCFTIDVQDPVGDSIEQIQDAVAHLIVSTQSKISSDQTPEFELMYRNGKMHIQRFVSENRLQKAVSSGKRDYESEETDFYQIERPLRVQVEKPGLLSSLSFVDNATGEIGADEVEIQSYAWGVNFKDVFVALGQMKPSQTMTGESAGVVLAVGSNFTSQYKVGDRVAIMLGTPYANRSRANGHLIHRIPDKFSFTDAASIPLAFATAYYGLLDCANLEQGQTVLIHAASGGVGQAAIKIAQRTGATIFATVGSGTKRQLLVDKYGIPENHIFSSRTTDFAAGIRRLTAGVGVDVILNSLSGPALQASWECIASLGTFVEIGKTDIYRHSQLDMEPFDRNVRFVSVDMVVLSERRPKHVQKILQQIFRDFEDGHFSSLPVTALPIGDIEKAFRLIQGRKHTGKVVLEADTHSMVQARVQPLRLRADGTYIIIGGLGGLGKHLCRHLQARGARHIALFSRRHFDDQTKKQMEIDLTVEPDSVVKVVTCDIADETAVKQVSTGISRSMPPVRGLIHGAMVLSDRTVSQITQADFSAALGSKYYGTKNLYHAFYNDSLDFFVMLSSLSAVIGTLGQSNYAAGGTYQDMFTHAQISSGRTKFITLDVPLIENTYPVSQARIDSLARQGCQLIPIESALPVIDYAMSGRAFKDGVHQIAFGLDPQSFIKQAQQGTPVPPLFSHITAEGRNLARRSDHATERSIDEQIRQASSTADVEQLILVAVREKISSLTALDSQELDLDTPVANMALDSLIATEIKNWITNTLQAPVQVSDITDAPSLRLLASFITQNSSLIRNKSGDNSTKQEANEDVEDAQVALPNYPLPPLETAMEFFLESVSHLGNKEEMQKTRKAVASFLSSDGVGKRLQSRMEELTNDSNVDDDVVDVYVRNKWLRGRDWRPRLRNFFATLPLPDTLPLDQADQAALVSLAAYDYKLSIDTGTMQQDLLNDQILVMETVYWLFNSNRTPVLECDRAERWPGNDYLVAMRHGHAYKVPLQYDNGQPISHGKLRAIFRTILEQAPPHINWASILATDNRDEWARVRDELIAVSPENENFISTIEKSMFVVCLDDTSPTTAKERADCFLLDDNSNRWLDKTVSFVVCANGVLSMFCEHTMVDGTTFGGLIDAIKTRTAEHAQATTNGQLTPITNGKIVANDGFTYLPFVIPATLDEYITRLRSEHLAAHAGYGLCNYTHTAYGAGYLRAHKLPPKSVIQLVVQIAVRRLFGYNPSGAVDVISQRPFRGGRTDMIYIGTDEVAAFCAAAEDPTVGVAERRRLFLEAVKSHARLVTLSTRGRGWRWHLMALREMLGPGEEPPELYEDVVYKRTSERPVCTSFTEFGLPETGRCQPKREDVWIGVQVLEKSVTFTVIDGQGKADELAGHIKGAAEVMTRIIEASSS